MNVQHIWTAIIIKGSLEQILPQLKFVNIAEHDLERYNTQYKVGNISDKETEILIADNSFIGPLIYNEQLPFKFIQVQI